MKPVAPGETGVKVLGFRVPGQSPQPLPGLAWPGLRLGRRRPGGVRGPSPTSQTVGRVTPTPGPQCTGQLCRGDMPPPSSVPAKLGRSPSWALKGNRKPGPSSSALVAK